MRMIYWLTQTRDDLPDRFDWLAPQEREQSVHLRESRLRDWLVGRWTAKRLICASIGSAYALSEITVLNTSDGASEVFVRGKQRFSLSISHANGIAFCAVSESGLLGIDVEKVAPRVAGFTDAYFSSAEQRLVTASSQNETLITAIWCGKEAALKALRIGLRVDPRAVNCRLLSELSADWQRFSLETSASLESPVAGLWGLARVVDGTVYTIVSETAEVDLQPCGKH